MSTRSRNSCCFAYLGDPAGPASIAKLPTLLGKV
jgi:hypothetical protein